MSKNVEILELGEDGSFDAPATSIVNGKPKTQPLDYANFDWSGIAREDNTEILEKLKAGEYAIYQSDNGNSWVIVKMENNDQVQLFQKEQILQLRTSDKKLDIQLPKEVVTTDKTISSKQWNGYVTILIEKSN